MAETDNLTDSLSRKKGTEPILIAYMTAGYPDGDTVEKWINLLLDNGVDGLELGYPTPRPELDGETIKTTHIEATRNGFQPEDYLELVKNVNGDRSFNRLIPMGYWAQLEELLDGELEESWKDAGLTDLLVPDLGKREAIERLRERGFNVVPFLRKSGDLSLYDSTAVPFVYCPTHRGKTGSGGAIDEEHLSELQKGLETSPFEAIPHLAGFAIKSGRAAERIMDLGYDGVIVGSALIEAFSESENRGLQLIREIKEAIGKEGQKG